MDMQLPTGDRIFGGKYIERNTEVEWAVMRRDSFK